MGQVFEHNGPFPFSQRPFGECRQRVRVRMIRHGCCCVQALAYDFGNVLHFSSNFQFLFSSLPG
jgi:hypothetical protein